MEALKSQEIIGLIRPDVDAHTLGVSVVAKLLEDCGYKVVIGNAAIAAAVAMVNKLDHISMLIKWIQENNISRLGFSYRLDPYDAQKNFGKVCHLLRSNKLFVDQGGKIREVYFAGLPLACQLILKEYNGQIQVFQGDETPTETLLKLGVPQNKIPQSITEGSRYDQVRMDFAMGFIRSGKHAYILPPEKGGYEDFGKYSDTVTKRIHYNRKLKRLPLMRVHVGPYNPDYEAAKKEFRSWLKVLKETAYLDVVSVGTSQLSQSDFGTQWGDKPNGGGVPINSEKDLVEIWEASRPMLVRTYSGTRNPVGLAEVYEKTINISWHALSFWWFNKIDGRGPHTLRQSLINHIDTLKIIAKHNKPFEPNIPHHFSFRGSDDYTYVLSSFLAAKTAKKVGVKTLILQTMFNTPKYTWGIQDLAKARALLQLVRELEDDSFNVFLQPRAGLDYFSPDLDKARVQLAAVTAMMDDIEPENPLSPDIIHVVSYCEAVELATPEYINESIQITIGALEAYRKEKKMGLIEDFSSDPEIAARTSDLYSEVKQTITILEQNFKNLYTAEGLYEVFKSGIMPVPYLWECREEFSAAVNWKTGLYKGGVYVLDDFGLPIKPSERLKQIIG